MVKGLLQKIHHLVEFEEHVGKLWHRVITRSASQRYPDAAVHLDEVKRSVAVMFRALGGDGGLRIETCHATDMQARRSWLQRIAGTNKQVELAWRNEDALYLPACIDVFAEPGLNRDLYLWLAALASGDIKHDQSWFAYNQWLSIKVIKRFPGLAARYQRLLEAQLALRPAITSLSADEAAQEQALQAALQQPGQVSTLPPLTSPRSRPLMPVYLWLHPCPPHAAAASALSDDDVMQDAGGEVVEPEDEHRYQAEQVEMPEGKSGLLLDRFENILSWAEYIKVDRTVEEDEDLDSAEEMARDLDQLSVAKDSRSSAKRIRFDLDLPAAESDDLPLGEGILLPEWDYRKADFHKDYCAIQPMIARDAEPCDLPLHLRATARRVRAQFETLQPTRSWLRGQQFGAMIKKGIQINFAAILLAA